MAPKTGEFVDDAGNQILRFISAARNLSRIGELANEVVDVAKSGQWRRYKTAVGLTEWRESEFDYFLISCDLSHEDIGRVVLHTDDWSTLAQIMDPNADATCRRPLEEAAAAWPSPSPESLMERAQRLGWTGSPTSTKLRAAPLPPRRKLYSADPTNDNRRASMMRRLASERADLYRRVLNDELSPYAAMREAGFLPKVVSINLDSPEKAAESLRRHLDQGELRRLLEALRKT